MPPAPLIAGYDWAGGREAMLRFGPAGGPVVLVAPPLLEEANRTRATLVAMLRAVAARGIAGALPDLPGQGESLVPTGRARLADWRAALAAAAAGLPGPVHVATVRGGGLVDDTTSVVSRWRLAPLDGAAQAREWRRAQALADQPTDLFAGNELTPDLLAAVEAAAPVERGPCRTVRLAGDPRPADAVLPFPPPWRAAEPRRDAALAEALAADLAQWIATCAG